LPDRWGGEGTCTSSCSCENSCTWPSIFIVDSRISTSTRASNVWRYQRTVVTIRPAVPAEDVSFSGGAYRFSTTLNVKRSVRSDECR
jgi:hypothetical protein